MNIKKLALSSICFAALSMSVWAADVKPVIDVWPAMVRLEYNPILQLDVSSDSELLREIQLDFTGTTNLKNIKEVSIFVGGDVAKPGKKFGSANVRAGKVNIKGTMGLANSDKIFVGVKLADKVASLNDTITLAVPQVKIGKSTIKVPQAKVTQRIGYTVAKPGDLGSKNYRIPAIVQTKKGTLVATFDIRYNHAGDLPANIDVGVTRSTDGGKTWTDIESVMTSKGMEVTKGVGDPGILYDVNNDIVWIAGLWAPQSGHPIWASVAGTTSPKNCGQMLLIKSKNDGKTWSKPINITESVKRLGDPDTKNWGLLFQGPGAGICMSDGTLVFPSQVWMRNKDNTKTEGEGASQGVLVYSKDGGKTWTSTKSTPFGGSESTCFEKANGSIALNTRTNKGWGRTGSILKKVDGKTEWIVDENLVSGAAGTLRQPGGCQGALLKVGGKVYFSNPDSGNGRRDMTVKMSSNEGKAWNAGLLYDARSCAGYSSLCTLDKDHIGVLYEGSPNSQVINFLSLPYSEIDKAKKAK